MTVVYSESMRGALMRSFQCMAPGTLTVTCYPEWAAVLHNLCFLHCAIRLRSQFGETAGWNYKDTMLFGNTELMEALVMLSDEFKDVVSDDGGQGISWAGVRYLLSDIIYGSNIIDDSDQASLAAMIDYWISPTTTKRDCELTRIRYKIPASFFTTNASLSSLVQAIDGLPPHLLDTPEAFNMHPTPDIHFGNNSYLLSWLNSLCASRLKHTDQKQSMSPKKSTAAVSSVYSFRESTLVAAQAGHGPQTSSIVKQSKEVELLEICNNLLPKVPKGWSKDFISERLRKLGGNTPFNLFIKKELSHLMFLLSEIKRNLQAIKSVFESENTLGDQLSAAVMSVAHDLFLNRTPKHWCQIGGSVTPPSKWSPTAWISELQQRVAHFEKILHLGREKMPTYWLGAFRNPQGLLSVLKQETIHQYAEKTGNAESVILQTEITQRDKEHMRDPPQEGMFVYGVYMWGVSWNTNEAELLDSPAKQSPAALPVIHLHCMSASEKLSHTDSVKATSTYQCPVYISTVSLREPVFHIGIHKENIQASRWALRGTKATLHPF